SGTFPTMPSPTDSGRAPLPSGGTLPEPALAIQAARERERAGCLPEAIGYYEAAIAAAKRSGERALWAEALRRLAAVRHRRDEAIRRYRRSLESYRACEDLNGCAIAYHNLGMVSADRELFDDADDYFRESLALAERVGDVYLHGLCLVNHGEVDVARQRFENA